MIDSSHVLYHALTAHTIHLLSEEPATHIGRDNLSRKIEYGVPEHMARLGGMYIDRERER
jgi:hypothetical protein